MTTPDSLWAEIAPLVVLPGGSRPLMRFCDGKLCNIDCPGVVPIPRSLSAALAAMGEMGYDVQIRVWNGRTEVIIYKPPMRYRTSRDQATPEAVWGMTYETILKALGAKEREA